MIISNDDDATDDNLQQQYRVLVAFTFMGVFFGVLTILLMVDMWRKGLFKSNGFSQLVVSLTITQLLYDVFILQPDLHPNSNSLKVLVQYFLQLFFGLCSTLISNAMMFIVCYTTCTLRFYDVGKHALQIFLSIFVIAFVNALVVLLGSLQFVTTETLDRATNFYEYMRSASVLFNAFAALVITTIFFHRGIFYIRCSTWSKSSNLDNKSKSDLNSTRQSNLASSPLTELVRRLSYYPFVQILTRLPETYVYFKYEFNYRFATLDSTYYNLQYLNNALFPSSGTGYFFIFLVLQPGAYRHFCSWFASFSSSKRDFAPDLTDMNEHIDDDDEDEERASADLSFSSARDSQQQRELEQQQQQQQQQSKKQPKTKASISTLTHLCELDENDLGELIERAYANNHTATTTTTTTTTTTNTKSSNNSSSSNNNNNNTNKRKSGTRLDTITEIEMRRSSCDQVAPSVPNPIVAAAAAAGDGWLTTAP